MVTLRAARLRFALRSMGELLDSVSWDFPRKPYDQAKEKR